MLDDFYFDIDDSMLIWEFHFILVTVGFLCWFESFWEVRIRIKLSIWKQYLQYGVFIVSCHDKRMHSSFQDGERFTRNCYKKLLLTLMEQGKNSLSIKITALRPSYVFIDHYGLQMTYNKLSRHLSYGDESLDNTD